MQTAHLFFFLHLIILCNNLSIIYSISQKHLFNNKDVNVVTKIITTGYSVRPACGRLGVRIPVATAVS